MPRRENTRSRRAPTAERYTILVYCGAVRTEPDYFDGLKRKLRASSVNIKLRQDGVAPDALVHLAISNPCFELWLLLHHADCRAPCAGCADVVRRLRRHVPGYDKTRLDFAHFGSGLAGAVKRARDLEPTGADHRRNPSTNLWQLVEEIMGPR